MRDIKFRAWCKNTNSMYPDVTYNKDAEEDINPWVFMQYTGLKDKNGKEIYEGDIVKQTPPLVRDILDDIPSYRIIKWKDESSCFKFYLLDGEEQSAGWIFTKKILNTSEIIGNIYENTELLRRDV